MNIATIIAIGLAVVRLIESIFQWANTQETKGVLDAIKTILKNFFVSIETYKK